MSMVSTLRLVIAGDSKGAMTALDKLDKKVSSSVKSMEAKAKQGGGPFGSWSSGLNKAANGAAVGFVGAIGIMTKSVVDFEKRGSLIKNTMRATGMDAEGASTLVGEWQRYGVEAGAAGMATKTLAKAIDGARQGNAIYADSFKRLGLSVEDLNKMSDTEAIFAVRDALAEMGAGLDRTTIATKLLGRGSQTMSAWYSQSAASMADTNQLLKDNGLIWDEKDVALYDKAIKAQRELQIAVAGISETVAKDVLPALTPFVGVLGSMLRFAQPLAPAIIPITIALGTFVGVVKMANLLSGAWGQTFGRLIPKIGATVIAEEAETVAITGQTVAIEANTVAMAENALAGGGGVGIAGFRGLAAGEGAAMAGTAVAGGGLATGAGLIVPALAGVAGVIATAFLVKYAMSGEVSQNVKNMNAAGIRTQGRMAGSVAQSDALDAANAAKMAPINKAWEEFAVIAQKIKDAKPGPGQVGALDRYKDELTKLEKKYPVVAEKADELKGALDKGADAFDAAAQAATDAAEKIRTAFSSMADFIKATNLAAVMGTPLPTPAQAAFASQSSQAAAFAAAQEAGYFDKQYKKNHPASAASGPLPWRPKGFKFVKGKWIRAAAGVDFITQGPTPIIAGEAGIEHVKITPLGRKGSAPSAPANVFDFRGAIFVGTSRDAERHIMDIVNRGQGKRVDRLTRGRFASV